MDPQPPEEVNQEEEEAAPNVPQTFLQQINITEDEIRIDSRLVGLPVFERFEHNMAKIGKYTELDTNNPGCIKPKNKQIRQRIAAPPPIANKPTLRSSTKPQNEPKPKLEKQSQPKPPKQSTKQPKSFRILRFFAHRLVNGQIQLAATLPASWNKSCDMQTGKPKQVVNHFQNFCKTSENTSLMKDNFKTDEALKEEINAIQALADYSPATAFNPDYIIDYGKRNKTGKNSALWYLVVYMPVWFSLEFAIEYYADELQVYLAELKTQELSEKTANLIAEIEAGLEATKEQATDATPLSVNTTDSKQSSAHLDPEINLVENEASMPQSADIATASTSSLLPSKSQIAEKELNLPPSAASATETQAPLLSSLQNAIQIEPEISLPLAPTDSTATTTPPPLEISAALQLESAITLPQSATCATVSEETLPLLSPGIAESIATTTPPPLEISAALQLESAITLPQSATCATVADTTLPLLSPGTVDSIATTTPLSLKILAAFQLESAITIPQSATCATVSEETLPLLSPGTADSIATTTPPPPEISAAFQLESAITIPQSATCATVSEETLPLLSPGTVDSIATTTPSPPEISAALQLESAITLPQSATCATVSEETLPLLSPGTVDSIATTTPPSLTILAAFQLESAITLPQSATCATVAEAALPLLSPGTADSNATTTPPPPEISAALQLESAITLPQSATCATVAEAALPLLSPGTADSIATTTPPPPEISAALQLESAITIPQSTTCAIVAKAALPLLSPGTAESDVTSSATNLQLIQVQQSSSKQPQSLKRQLVPSSNCGLEQKRHKPTKLIPTGNQPKIDTNSTVVQCELDAPSTSGIVNAHFRTTAPSRQKNDLGNGYQTDLEDNSESGDDDDDEDSESFYHLEKPKSPPANSADLSGSAASLQLTKNAENPGCRPETPKPYTGHFDIPAVQKRIDEGFKAYGLVTPLWMIVGTTWDDLPSSDDEIIQTYDSDDDEVTRLPIECIHVYGVRPDYDGTNRIVRCIVCNKWIKIGAFGNHMESRHVHLIGPIKNRVSNVF